MHYGTDWRYHLDALKSRLVAFLFERGGLLALATLALYLWVAPAHIMNGDNADFAATGTVGGAAHPSGYPLYLMWLRLWSVLPVAPAHATAIATVILGAAAVLALHAACRVWGARPLAATFAVGLFATAPIVLRIHTEADVFPLNCLISATIVWLAALEGPLKGARRAAALALMAGLGISHNLTCVLIAPIGILGVVRGIREASGSARAVGLALAAFVAGLLPYLYLLVTPETLVSWGKVDDLAGLIRHILREDYGTWQLSGRGTEVYGIENLGELLRSMLRAYLWVPFAIGLAALGVSLVRPLGKESRLGWAMLIACVLLTGPILIGRFNVNPVHLGLYLTQRFHIQSMMLFAVFVAIGIDRAAALAADRVSMPALAKALTVTSFIAGAALSLPYLSRVHTPAAEQGLRNMLTSLPPAAIVIGAPDEFHFGMGYLQAAVGLRADVAIIATPQLGLAYYRNRVQQRTGIVIAKPSASDKLSVVIAEQALATGRPVFIDAYQANIAKSFPVYPYGILYRVLPRGSSPPSIGTIFALNQTLFANYRFGYSRPGMDDQLATQFHLQYARVWQSLADGLGTLERHEDQAFALQLVDELAPRDDE